MKIAQDKVVAIHYRVTNEASEERDASDPEEPLVYLHGRGELVPGLEAALLGCESGESVSVTLAPADGYGEHDPDLDVKIPLTSFPDDMRGELEEGVVFAGEHPDDDSIEVIYQVVEVLDEHVLASGNHPLAGETLIFDVDVVSVRDPTADELDHGHAHGPDGHGHH